MDAPEVVEHEVQSYGMAQILNLLAKGVGKAGKAPHGHTHGQVLALDVRCGNGLLVRVPDHLPLANPAALAKAVAGSCITALVRVAIDLLEQPEVDFLTEGGWHGAEMSMRRVRSWKTFASALRIAFN